MAEEDEPTEITEVNSFNESDDEIINNNENDPTKPSELTDDNENRDNGDTIQAKKEKIAQWKNKIIEKNKTNTNSNSNKGSNEIEEDFYDQLNELLSDGVNENQSNNTQSNTTKNYKPKSQMVEEWKNKIKAKNNNPNNEIKQKLNNLKSNNNISDNIKHIENLMTDTLHTMEDAYEAIQDKYLVSNNYDNQLIKEFMDQYSYVVKQHNKIRTNLRHLRINKVRNNIDENEKIREIKEELDSIQQNKLENQEQLKEDDNITDHVITPFHDINKIPDNGRNRENREEIKILTDLDQWQVNEKRINNLDNLRSQFPWFQDIIDDIELSLIAKDQLDPMCLVGMPGCGKTSFLKQLLETVELPMLFHSLAGSNQEDINLNGTNAGYANSQPSLPVKAMLKTQMINPAIVFDELDKSSIDNDDANAIISKFIEPTSASYFYDQHFCADMDISTVNYLFTANEIDAIPNYLQNRLNIQYVKQPQWEHLDLVLDTIINEWLEQNHLTEFKEEFLNTDLLKTKIKKENKGFDFDLRTVQHYIDTHLKQIYKSKRETLLEKKKQQRFA